MNSLFHPASRDEHPVSGLNYRELCSITKLGINVKIFSYIDG